jgi:hypothetical protein
VFRATKAGALYAIIVFVIGFILGTIRVLLVVPRLGETTAVIIEGPTMLAASRFVCRWCVGRLRVGRTVPPRLLMGFVAFLLLMSAEVGFGAVPVDRSWISLPPTNRTPERSFMEFNRAVLQSAGFHRAPQPTATRRREKSPVPVLRWSDHQMSRHLE